MVLEDVTSGRLIETVQVGPRDADLPSMSQWMAPAYNAAYLQSAPEGSGAWWLRRLTAKLDARAARMRAWEEYYRGIQPLAFASDKFRDAFGGRFRAFSSNFMALVVDGTRERMEITGFTLATQRATKKAWRIWQDNSMDAYSLIAHTEALIKSECYTLITPTLEGPRITIEDPLNAIVETSGYDPRIRRAGLKRWLDDAGHVVVYVYLPEMIWKLRSEQVYSSSEQLSYVPWPRDGEAFGMPNPLGVVPMVPLVNRPRVNGTGQSEIDAVMSNQDAVNKYRADALVAAEFAAFRQRWAIGLDIPEDPKTGLPVEPFKAAVDRLWVVPPPDADAPPDQQAVQFGEFAATDLTPYQTMIESEVGAISSISRLPYHYLLGQPQAVPPSGESLKSSEAGLVKKVRTQMIHFGEGWEETIRLALLAAGDLAASRDRSTTTQWADPETRNEGVRTDATVKAYQTGIIDRDEARAALGYAPGEVEDTPVPVDEDTPDDDAVRIPSGT